MSAETQASFGGLFPMVKWGNWIQSGVVLAIAVMVIRGISQVQYNWQWYRLRRYLPRWDAADFIPGPFLEGLAVTFKITLISLVLAFFIGLLTALARLSKSRLAPWLARLYLEAVRNTPLLVQLFFIYFVLAPILGLSGFWAAVWALSLFEGAYASEIFRAGIISIPDGQWEAARSIGLPTARIYRLIVIPQAVRHMLPPLTSQAISLVKDSALVSTIAVYDLTMQGQAIIADTYLVFEVWFLVAGIYLVINLVISLLVLLMEKKFKAFS